MNGEDFLPLGSELRSKQRGITCLIIDLWRQTWAKHTIAELRVELKAVDAQLAELQAQYRAGAVMEAPHETAVNRTRQKVLSTDTETCSSHRWPSASTDQQMMLALKLSASVSDVPVLISAHPNIRESIFRTPEK